MQNAIAKVMELQNAVGTIQKQAILKKYEGDKGFCDLLYYALNPMLTYKISERTMSRPLPDKYAIPLISTDICVICDTLANRKALDDSTVDQVLAFLNLCSPVERDFYTKLLSKTLRLGVTAKTVNKVIPGLIPEWEVQQAYPIDKYPVKEGDWFALTQKLNGVRATFYKGKLYARSGVPYEGLDHIIDVLEGIKGLGDLVFDGELTLYDNGGLSDNEAFRKATGIINSDDPDKTAICYTIFDVVDTSEFEKDQCEAPYIERRAMLQAVSDHLPKECRVSVLPVLYTGTKLSMIDEFLEQMVNEDKEGLIVNLNVPYQRKRHRGILKVKRFYTMDLPIVACEEGSGRLAGTLGAFVLDYKENLVRVGSGFSDEQRSDFWNRRDDLLGMLCEVKYKEISSDKNTGAESLQFPIFVSLRDDKTEPNYE